MWFEKILLKFGQIFGNLIENFKVFKKVLKVFKKILKGFKKILIIVNTIKYLMRIMY